MKLNFEHKQAAHCENGVTRNLLKHAGVNFITEPLAFGIGSGLFYIHLPFMKVNGGPAISFRTQPGLIFKRTAKSLGINIIRKKFSSEEEAQKALDECLQQGQPAGCQVGVYYLTYFPKEYRFHFNAHNLVVFGKEGDSYIISDPIMEYETQLNSYELNRVRFAKGFLAPKGQLYYLEHAKEISEEQIRRAIKKGIKLNLRDMLHIPGSFAGVSGIAYTGRKIKKWRDKLGLQKAGSYLAQIVRMQEEIGTGGGGFRFLYGAFLQEANQYFHKDELLDISKQFTQAGDQWRNAAVQASGIYKGRITSQADFDVMGDYLIQISEMEKKAFQDLAKVKLDA